MLCIASVPGAKEDDYKVDEELNKLVVEESELRELDEAKRKAKLLNEGHELDEDEVSGIGAISYISCAVGSETTKLDVDEEPSKLNKLREIVVSSSLRRRISFFRCDQCCQLLYYCFMAKFIDIQKSLNQIQLQFYVKSFSFAMR